MKKIFRKEVLIGLIVIFSIAVLVIGIDFLKGVNVFKASNYYYVSYTNVEGLAQSAPVTINGFKIGLVRDISYEYDKPGHVLVELSLNKDLKVPRGTKALLASDLLGTASVQLVMPDSKDFHAVGDTLDGAVKAGLMEDVQKELMPSVAGVLPKIDSLLTSINNLASDPALAASVKRLDNITQNLELTTRQLNALMGTLPPITTNVKAITENVSTATADMAVLTGRVKEMPLDSVMANINAISANLKELSDDLGNKNSTLGKLMNDPTLYNSINATVGSLDSLLVDIKKNPKRYISIKLL